MVPSEWPTKWARLMFKREHVLCTASTKWAMLKSPSQRCERPLPGKSTRTTRWRAKAGIKGVKVLLLPPMCRFQPGCTPNRCPLKRLPSLHSLRWSPKRPKPATNIQADNVQTDSLNTDSMPDAQIQTESVNVNKKDSE